MGSYGRSAPTGDCKREMSQRNHKTPIASTLATLAGCAIVFGSLLLIAVFPRLHLAVALAIGFVFGTPFIVLGLRLDSSSDTKDETSGRFWPTRTEARGLFWGLVAFATLAGSILVPFGLVIAIGFYMPPGDTWGIVAGRLLFVATAMIAGYMWLQYASATIPNWFRGRISDETLDAFLADEPPESPTTARAAAVKHWQVAAIALLAFCIASGVIDFQSPWLDIDAGSKRTRGAIRVLQWCRGNPNTVTSSSFIVGLVATGWYAVKIRQAAAAPKQTSTDSTPMP